MSTNVSLANAGTSLNFDGQALQNQQEAEIEREERLQQNEVRQKDVATFFTSAGVGFAISPQGETAQGGKYDQGWNVFWGFFVVSSSLFFLWYNYCQLPMQ